MNRLLIVDDDADTCVLLKKFFEKQQFTVDTCFKGSDAVINAKTNTYQVILSDFRLPDIDGLNLLQKFKSINPDIPVIIITGYSDVKVAIESIRKGAFDYVTKPLYPDEILATVKEAMVAKPAMVSVGGGNGTIAEAPASPQTGMPTKKFIKSVSPQLKNVYQHIELVAPTMMSVLVQGETGVGKENIASLIHENSQRKGKPFVAIDCGALSNELAGSELFGHEKGAFTGASSQRKGSFETANGGTIFLDEIGNLSYDNQVKLLRAIQERKVRRLGSSKDIEVDVRIVAATNEDLKEAAENGTFRLDLYHRLNEFSLFIPPLRERKEDIKHYLMHFIKESNEALGRNVQGISKDAEHYFMTYPWEGNLRELRNVVKRAVLLTVGGSLESNVLPREIIEHQAEEFQFEMDSNDASNLKTAAGSAEREVIIKTLRDCANNKSKAAKELKIDRKTLYNKLKEYNIHY
ncbi:sigma-54 dependent transcriptional regulator [Flammeovirgaceae bacterium SG7u.111]|nr:sigma-54 dependent transcriptional regulator [Flammeovirgaceae bacterium SG7u.132]WPO34361.1 sigma-54 dependent transcriptional regulator [Flammeovirgaceae bacterium SG7u.111]